MKQKFKYLRDIHYRIFGIYYNGHIVKTNPDYCGLIIDDKEILKESDCGADEKDYNKAFELFDGIKQILLKRIM